MLILRLRNVPAIDATGLHALMDVVRRSRRDGTRILLAELRTQPLMAMERSGALEEIGEDNVHETLAEAIAAAS